MHFDLVSIRTPWERQSQTGLKNNRDLLVSEVGQASRLVWPTSTVMYSRRRLFCFFLFFLLWDQQHLQFAFPRGTRNFSNSKVCIHTSKRPFFLPKPSLSFCWSNPSHTRSYTLTKWNIWEKCHILIDLCLDYLDLSLWQKEPSSLYYIS